MRVTPFLYRFLFKSEYVNIISESKKKQKKTLVYFYTLWLVYSWPTAVSGRSMR